MVFIVHYCYPKRYPGTKGTKVVAVIGFCLYHVSEWKHAIPPSGQVFFYRALRPGWPCELSNSADMANFAV